MSLATTDAANKDQIAFWNSEAGETWASLQERLDRQIQPLGDLAMVALDLRAGERLIDAGCGCGQTSVQLAARAGPSGEILAIDISAPMLAVARRRPRAPGLAPITFLEADAQVHAFDKGSTDAIFSRFGVMFFSDPTAAFANMRAALVPGGRLAFVCWRDLALNPIMTAPFVAALPLLPAPPPPTDPDAPGPFAFADERKVRAILSGAGFSDIALTPHDEAIGGGDLEQTTETALRIGPLGRALREQPQLAAKVRSVVREALAPFSRPDGVFLDSASWIVTARNPQESLSGA